MQELVPILDGQTLKIDVSKLTGPVTEIHVTFINIPNKMPAVKTALKQCAEGELVCVKTLPSYKLF